jgi:outer membrane protein assembly factor BamD (BamD/ComL family)
MKIILVVFWGIVLTACSTFPGSIPEELSPGELVQRAQEESDRNRYDAAALYYNAILERFPDDKSAVCGARYEIAFIHYKQKKYDIAVEEFDSLLDRYDDADGDLLPQKYFILSTIVLENINKTRNKRPQP